MCGIAGFYGRGEAEDIDRMVSSLDHRGPDDSGVFRRGTVAIGQSRLSILDLSPAGHQPMFSADKTIGIVFNGEIYNFKELKNDLSAKGYRFASQSDTEVIIYLYKEYGEDCFKKLNGMFAIAIYDITRERIILARDRMGKKPLYWGVFGGTLVFGSELKALMTHGSFKKELDLESLSKYFQYEYVPTPHSIFKNVYKLEAGSFLIWDGKTANKKSFWQPTFLPKVSSFDSSLRELDIALMSAVSDRLISDVPLGIFLSGGIDSSAIAYYATKASSSKIKTFSIGFKEASFDESQFARQVAKHLETEHYEKILSVAEGRNLIVDIGGYLDEPIADASIVPTYLLSKFTREHVTVALGGDGGDELFCGYDTFLAHRLSSLYEKLPLVLRKKIIEPIALRLPTSYANMSLDFKIKRFVGGFEGESRYRDYRWMGAFNHEEREGLFASVIWGAVKRKNEFEDVDSYLEKADSKDFFDNLGLLYQRMYMMDQVLVKVDRASMMNSLEVRAPFLDSRVVELANHLPVEYKFKGTERKHILKKLMEGKLPPQIIHRKKKGFGMPVGRWLMEDLRSVVDDVLSRENVNKMGLFDYDYIDRIKRRHYEGKGNDHKKLWTLLVFTLWYNNWYK